MNSALERRLAALSPEQRELLMRRLERQKTAEVAKIELPRIEGEPVGPGRPVPLTEIQESYLIGGGGVCDLGGSATNVYLEYETTGSVYPFAAALETAFQRAVERHGVLRSVVRAGLRQEMLDDTPAFRVEVEDLSHRKSDAVERALDEVREELRYGRPSPRRWPLFQVVAHQLADGAIRLHARFDGLLVDGMTREMLIEELASVVSDPETEIPAPPVSFLDHAEALARFRDTDTWAADRHYWLERVDGMPPVPEVPLVRPLGPSTVPRVTKVERRLLDDEPWSAVRRRAAALGVTPTTILTAVFVEILRSWSSRTDFTLGLEGSYLPPTHGEIRRVVGNFATIQLLAVDSGDGTFEERVRRLQERMAADLEHAHYSGHRVVRHLHERHGAGCRGILPFLFDSVLELAHESYQRPAADEPAPPSTDAAAADPAGNAETGDDAGEMTITEVDMRISLNQVLLLCVVIQAPDGGLHSVTQEFAEVLPEGMVDELMATFQALLERLAGDGESWREEQPLAALLGGVAMSATDDGPEVPEVTAADRCLVASDPGLLAVLDPEGASERLELAPDEGTAPDRLAARLTDGGVTVWSGPPSLLAECLARGARPSSLRLALLDGEAVPAGLAGRLGELAPGIALWTTWGSDSRDGAPVALGRAAPGGGGPFLERCPGGETLDVVDPRGLRRPDGVPGELVAVDPSGGRRPLGTRARRLATGPIEVLVEVPRDAPARLGYSFDPRRVERRAETAPGVAVAVVRPVEDRLVAWVVPDGGEHPEPAAITTHLRQTLPGHQVPDEVVVVERAPRHPDGRLDRSALPVPPAPRPVPVAELGEAGEALVGLWREVLGNAPETDLDDFFAHGGDSRGAFELLHRVAEHWNLEFPVADFYARPTPRGMLAALGTAAAAGRGRDRRPGLFSRFRDKLDDLLTFWVD